jgi:hypothetical protein
LRDHLQAKAFAEDIFFIIDQLPQGALPEFFPAEKYRPKKAPPFCHPLFCIFAAICQVLRAISAGGLQSLWEGEAPAEPYGGERAPIAKMRLGGSLALP